MGDDGARGLPSGSTVEIGNQSTSDHSTDCRTSGQLAFWQRVQVLLPF
jgi:hypothetical protein